MTVDEIMQQVRSEPESCMLEVCEQLTQLRDEAQQKAAESAEAYLKDVAVRKQALDAEARRRQVEIERSNKELKKLAACAQNAYETGKAAEAEKLEEQIELLEERISRMEKRATSLADAHVGGNDALYAIAEKADDEYRRMCIQIQAASNEISTILGVRIRQMDHVRDKAIGEGRLSYYSGVFNKAKAHHEGRDAEE